MRHAVPFFHISRDSMLLHLFCTRDLGTDMSCKDTGDHVGAEAVWCLWCFEKKEEKFYPPRVYTLISTPGSVAVANQLLCIVYIDLWCCTCCLVCFRHGVFSGIIFLLFRSLIFVAAVYMCFVKETTWDLRSMQLPVPMQRTHMTLSDCGESAEMLSRVHFTEIKTPGKRFCA